MDLHVASHPSKSDNLATDPLLNECNGGWFDNGEVCGARALRLIIEGHYISGGTKNSFTTYYYKHFCQVLTLSFVKICLPLRWRQRDLNSLVDWWFHWICILLTFFSYKFRYVANKEKLNANLFLYGIFFVAEKYSIRIAI